MGAGNEEMIRRARRLRREATPQERKLWYEFLRGHPARFRRQQPVGPYIVDFYCPAARLAVELDGGGHYEPEQMEYDARRDAYLREQGMRVIRFTNLEIRNEFSAVCGVIDRAVWPNSVPGEGEPT
ncbi:MAG: endonuclease domain-containing protein [Oscillospiraceae bacterium]|nr:endonuclease domain-containing protein [Oscillospiraceae bacterium]